MKYLFGLVFLFCITLGGCGGQAGNQSSETSVASVRPESSGSGESSSESPESTEGVNINYAGLLQESCGSVMVQLEGGGLLGSGVIAGMDEEKIVILTAAHVIASADSYVRVTFFDEYQAVSRENYYFEDQDIGAVIVKRADVPEENLQQYQSASWNTGNEGAAKQGDICIAMGCTSGVAAEAYEGTIADPWIFIEDYGQHMILARVNGIPGMSGGGLFNQNGKLWGIVSGGNEDGELAVIPLSLFTIKVDFLEELVDNDR